jgi:hypothetical protein
MGYELHERVYKLQLRGSEYDGIEVRVGECTVAEHLAARVNDAVLLELFGQYLLGWNITRDGQAVPCKAENLPAIGANLALSLAVRWLQEQQKPARDRPFPVPDPESNGAGAGTEIAAL